MPLTPLITTKLHIPQVRSDLVQRTLLWAQLEEGLKVPLLFISAPPGFGKSMLMASWLHSRPTPLPTAWLSLDENDNEPRLFWRYCITALQTLQPGLGETGQVMLSAQGSPDMPMILTTLINELAALQFQLLLVLDDYHLIQNPDLHENVRFLLDHLPGNVHLALITREDPPLGLARRRARRQMIEIRAAHLRFDAREAAEFLNGTCQLALLPQQIASLEQRTEGWITGLQMAALSLQGRNPAQFIEAFSSDNRYIADYLIEEVLQRQPEEIRTFLFKTSILERFSAPLCAAVSQTDNAREAIDTLERTNLFIMPLDDKREWYRYHHLFAELLRQRLRDAFPASEIASLHQNASLWYEGQMDIASAVRHARKSGDEPRAMALLERYSGIFFATGHLPQLFDLARVIPPAVRHTLPRICAAVAWAALASNQFDAVDDWLKAIERHFNLPAAAAIERTDLPPDTRAALIEVLVIRLQLPAYPPTEEHVAALQAQIQALPSEQACLFNVIANLQPVISFNQGLLAERSGKTALAAIAFEKTLTVARDRGNRYLYHLGRAHLAALQINLGQLHLARQTCEQGLAEDPTLISSPYLSILHAYLGALHEEWREFSAAETHYQQGLPLALLWNLWEGRVPITQGLARFSQRAGKLDTALKQLAEIYPQPIENLNLGIGAQMALLQMAQGLQTEPAAWLNAQIAAGKVEPTVLQEQALPEVARLLILLQRPAEAEMLLKKLAAMAGAGDRQHTLIRARVVLARALAVEGKTNEASACLLEILPLAAPEGYLSTFVDEGETIRQLLADLRGKSLPVELRAYLESILAAFEPGAPLPARREPISGLPELSEREREILNLVAEGLSNPEIAARLTISITTVKTHVGNIFNKLGVNSRTQAIARAEALRLLPRH